MYKITLGSIPNDWKHLELKLLKNPAFIKTFCNNSNVTNKVTKRLPKLSNREMYFTLLI